MLSVIDCRTKVQEYDCKMLTNMPGKNAVTYVLVVSVQ